MCSCQISVWILVIDLNLERTRNSWVKVLLYHNLNFHIPHLISLFAPKNQELFREKRQNRWRKRAEKTVCIHISYIEQCHITDALNCATWNSFPHLNFLLLTLPKNMSKGQIIFVKLENSLVERKIIFDFLSSPPFYYLV